MTRYLLRRLLITVVVMTLAITAVFVALHASGEPIVDELTAAGATQEQIQTVLHQLGYDRPLVEQLGSFWADLFRGDLGTSYRYHQSTVTLIADRAPYTLWLAGYAILLTAVFGLVLGALAASFPNTLVDRAIRWWCSLAMATPSFVVGVFLILVFAVSMRVVPVSGAASGASVILPAATLALAPAARIGRLLRGSMLEVAQSDYVTTARAKGVSERGVLVRHQLRNALLPVVTVLAMQVSALVGGAVIVESVFTWPGLGTLAVTALSSRDFPLVQAIVVLMVVVVMVVNLVTDLLYTLLDPRISYS